MSNVNFTYTNLTPFKWYVLENFPFIEADFDALTNWQLFCKLGKEINKVINSTNTLGTQVETLTDYVSNYFDNLDVQEEINNKLNDMAESGELEGIIISYLELNTTLCFNTLNEMKNAEYLSSGSFVKTFGNSTYNDGLGNYYKVRSKLSGEIADNINIVELHNTNLVAEKIIKRSSNLMNDRRFVCIGDSYNITNTNDPSETVLGWGSYLQEYLNLPSNNFYNYGRSGAGWAKTNNQFITLLQDNEANITNKNTITDILVLGGVNDNAMTNSEIFNAIKEFSNYCLQNYPNAIITIGLLSWARSESLRKRLMQMLQYYNNTSYFKNIRVVPRLFQIIHCYNLQIEDGHPNNVGNQNIAYFMFNYLKNGVMDNSQISDVNLYATDNTLGLTNNQLIGTQYHTINKYNVNILININDITSFSTPTELRSGNNYKLGAFNDIFAKCNNLPLTYGCGWAYDGSKYYSFNYVLIANNGDLYFRILSYADTGTLSFTPSAMGFGKIPPIILPLELC